MMAGKLDRRIMLQSCSTNRHPVSNELIETWADICTVSAGVTHTGGREFLDQSGGVSERKAVFLIRYRCDVDQLDRISYDGWFWNIRDYREIGRREGLELHCTANDIGAGT